MEKNIPVAEFKTHCYNLLDQANKSKSELIITRRGKAIAKVIPIDNNKRISMMGTMQDRAIVKSDIINTDSITWNVQSE